MTDALMDVERPISTTAQTAVADETIQPRPTAEDERIDGFARGVFEGLGYESLPDELVESYLKFKGIKDRMHTGRLTPEGFATVVMLANCQPKG